jgi:hypothetical protein
MSYQLYRLADADPGSLLLGSYEAFEDALTARDEDTVRLFAATSPGDLMLVRHDIIGPGAHGPATLHPVTTAVERRSPADLDEVDDVRGWLARIHAVTS